MFLLPVHIKVIIFLPDELERILSLSLCILC